RALLKPPITTRQGGGYKSRNVTIRKTLGLYANVRPCIAYAPFVETAHPHMDIVVIRENEEDLYAGIEHRQTDEVYQCLKLITRPGCERIIRYAFEYARANRRRKVTCMTKDNIMKLTDGLFHRVFDEIGAEYPEIERDHFIIDIGMARVATRPERFDVIVTPNLYGDILSDVAAELTGSVGLAPSANIGETCSMFEAIHGSAPMIAGQGIANPSGLLLGAVQMLVHIGQPEVAETVHNAWLKTLEDGIHTPDIYREGVSQKRVSTQEFGDAVAARVGQRPTTLAAVEYDKERNVCSPVPRLQRRPAGKKEVVGIDVFVHDRSTDKQAFGDKIAALSTGKAKLRLVTNRGVLVWPDGFPETAVVDHWRCRFMATEGTISSADVVELLGRFAAAGVDFVKTEQLCKFDGVVSYSQAQGE
ncbi:MAG TPA: NADP-dependent isocitrate dehydrogenase, partial [Armatimonadetes bacterium]|nr:NADP-dependent isocitrate dehydrogenase [Armatimonadota bacterium]